MSAEAIHRGACGRLIYFALRGKYRCLSGLILSGGCEVLQVAVFVDAGYLFAQGSALLAGQKQPRQNIQLIAEEALSALCRTAEEVAPNARLLRIYWYDGLLRGNRPSADQLTLANSPRTKLRLGMVNSQGQQKGVDSLIVTDLIDLARNSAISDALLLAGDEDLRIGAQIAQTFGVQIHLLGIKPARGSQSPDLIQEADTHQEWDEAVIERVMSVTLGAPAEVAAQAASTATDQAASAEFSDDLIQQEINTTLASESEVVLHQYLTAYRVAPGTVPAELDRPTLGRIGAKVGRRLEREEVRHFRQVFCARLQEECDRVAR